MTIWLLALVLMASLAALGYRQGAIRVAFSFLGILIGIMLAGPLARLVRPILGAVGVKNPTLVWVLGPFIIFVLVSIIFKIAAFPVHHKVEVHYKYKAGDLRFALWERLNRRLGLCLGAVNGFIYCLLISFVAYGFSYWTVQMANPESDSRMLNLLNRMGRDLQASGFAKSARAIDPFPQTFYDVADLAGLLYKNPLAEARLSRYPAFLSLAEQPPFQDLAADAQFTEMRQKGAPLMEVYHYPKIAAIVQNPDLLKTIWQTLTANLHDLRVYLEEGKSPKYDSEKILGRWVVNVNAAIALLRKTKPDIPSSEMQKVKRFMLTTFAKTTFVAAPDHMAILKNSPALKSLTATPELQTWQGQWQSQDGKYQLSLTANGKTEELAAEMDGDRLNVTGGTVGLVFSPED